MVGDPCDSDFHLREQMMNMARNRAPQFHPGEESRLRKTIDDDNRRSMMLMPPDAMRGQLREFKPNLSKEEVEAAIPNLNRFRSIGTAELEICEVPNGRKIRFVKPEKDTLRRIVDETHVPR